MNKLYLIGVCPGGYNWLSAKCTQYTIIFEEDNGLSYTCENYKSHEKKWKWGIEFEVMSMIIYVYCQPELK